jgi:ATP/maltotriose-dependent transcriptional regulator MalT
MSIVQIVLLLFIILGIILTSISLFFITKKNNNYKENYFEKKYYEAENVKKNLDTSIKQIDESIEHFEKYSKSVFDEIEQRYQELLFLYKLIDDKKQEMADNYYSKKIVEKEASTNSFTNISEKEENNDNLKNTINPKFVTVRNKDIIDMSKSGLSIPEIAKRLNIGQGEVKIVLDMGKAR